VEIVLDKGHVAMAIYRIFRERVFEPEAVICMASASAAMRDGVTRLRAMRPEYQRPDQTNELLRG
jgi:hypothetical protein